MHNPYMLKVRLNPRNRPLLGHCNFWCVCSTLGNFLQHVWYIPDHSFCLSASSYLHQQLASV